MPFFVVGLKNPHKTHDHKQIFVNFYSPWKSRTRHASASNVNDDEDHH
ncbi:hypothetical protein DSCW_59960 [Desulfosarcina widdelii]|uniref:Uncharacterized protein n=1 Tax=Desulfosarcina widdelii TaxID=947919 RepID=A0A5K7ZEK0_9BACT|nr:hypothetical protein DSCW_59960 [Desulfosarcina widdelii]